MITICRSCGKKKILYSGGALTLKGLLRQLIQKKQILINLVKNVYHRETGNNLNDYMADELIVNYNTYLINSDSSQGMRNFRNNYLYIFNIIKNDPNYRELFYEYENIVRQYHQLKTSMGYDDTSDPDTDDD